MEAQETLRHDEALPRDGEARCVVLQQESRRAPQCGRIPPITRVGDVVGMRPGIASIERDELQTELCAIGIGPRKPELWQLQRQT